MKKTRQKQLVAWRERRELAISLHEAGIPLSEIGMRLRPRCSKQRVHQMIKQHRASLGA